MTSLGDEVYVLRWKERTPIEVYDVTSFLLLRCRTVPNFRGFTDMTSCEHYRCLYIADPILKCIHRLNVPGDFTRWAVDDEPRGLSVNAACNVLVTCVGEFKIKEFSSHGELLRELTLPDDVVNPWHAIQASNGEFIVCHGCPNDAVHRVCKLSVNGHDIVQSHGGQRGSDTGLYNVPVHLAVDNNEFVFVVDLVNRRVTLLSPTFGYVRQVVSRDQLKWVPTRLYLDAHQRRLYVADNQWKDDNWATGRVVVFSV